MSAFQHEELCTRHHEATLGGLATVTAFLNRCTNQFREQGLGQAADLWMTRHHSRQWAAISLDGVGTVTPFQFCQAAKCIEDGDRRFEPRMQLSSRDRPLRREMTTRRTQDLFHFLSSQALVQLLQELTQHRTISLREQFFGCWCQVVDGGGLAAATTPTALLDQPLPLQGRQLSAD